MVEIVWNYDNDARITIAKGNDNVLNAFFCMDDWEFIRHCYDALILEQPLEFKNRYVEFDHKFMILGIDDKETILEKQSGLKSFVMLFDQMIEGANDDHHSIRYEPWWQLFTETNYQLKQQLELLR